MTPPVGGGAGEPTVTCFDVMTAVNRYGAARYQEAEARCDPNTTTNERDAMTRHVVERYGELALALDAYASSRAGRGAVVEECAKAIEAIDPLKVAADWDNSDDIGYEVHKACVAAVRALALSPDADGGEVDEAQ